eukprot:1410681-Lingulodinium_polyedra.AAC.1
MKASLSTAASTLLNTSRWVACVPLSPDCCCNSPLSPGRADGSTSGATQGPALSPPTAAAID